MPASIIKLLLVRLVFDNNYFNNLYLGIPIDGYNKLIDGLLEGDGCKEDIAEYNDWQKYIDKLVY